jgi:hypothetical protein
MIEGSDPERSIRRVVKKGSISICKCGRISQCCAVSLLRPQPMTPEGEELMRAMTERLIDRVLALGGSYYLPYRLHARADQLRAAYPRIEEFVARKRAYDPQLRFRNMMWEKYFA